MQESVRRELFVVATLTADFMVEIMVSDTGHGVPEEFLPKLFEPFMTTKETGMGVGLSISKTIIEAHGGRSGWKQTLLAEPYFVSHFRPSMWSRSRAVSSNGMVYVIDDDSALRDSLSFLLASSGLSVRLFDSAEAFLAAPPPLAEGCILTDIRMQGLDGIELLCAFAKPDTAFR